MFAVLRRLMTLLVVGGTVAAQAQTVTSDFQVEMELYDLQTEQSIYYKFDPNKNAPPHEKPQVINLLRWQSLRAERNTSILVRSSVQSNVSTVLIRFQGPETE